MVAAISDEMARVRRRATGMTLITIPSGLFGYAAIGGVRLGRDGAADEVDDRRRRRARGEDLGHPELLELRDVLRGDRAADRDDDVLGVLLAQELHDARDERHVRAGEDGEPDRVRVLLEHGLDDLLRRLVKAGVDDLHAGVAQRAGDDLRPAVVPVQAGLGDDDADLAAAGGHGGRDATPAAGPPGYLTTSF